METVGSYEAKTHLPALLNRVAQGERITITRHGVPIAVLVPANPHRRLEVIQIIDELRRKRKGRRPGVISIRELLEKAGRY